MKKEENSQARLGETNNEDRRAEESVYRNED